MEIFGKFYGSIIPYLLCIPVGYWIGKKELFSDKWLTGPLVYVMMPILVIYHFLEADETRLLFLPPIAFLMALAMVIPALYAHRTFAEDYDKNLIKCSFSFFNVAFFGIPVVSALYGEQGITILICIYIGTGLYGDIIGYYQIARSKYSQKKALAKIFTVPFIYAFLLALILKLSQVEFPEGLEPVTETLGVLVSIAGMLVIGNNLKSLKFSGVDWGFVKKSVGFRTVAAMIFMSVLIGLEYLIFDKLEGEDREILALVALFPVAANVTVFAAFFGSEEEDSALLVAMSMVLALVVVPIAAFAIEYFG